MCSQSQEKEYFQTENKLKFYNDFIRNAHELVFTTACENFRTEEVK
jgi:hypothetical protein